MRLRRLLGMGPAEISTRARQQISMWSDRLLASSRSAPTLPLRGARLLPSGIFPAGATHDRTPSFLDEHAPEHRHRVLATAEAILSQRFDLLGYRGLSFGDPVDWHLDPVNGRRAPLRHWSLIDPLDTEQVGDSKVIWELNRHQWLVRLGQAYRLTRDERFAHAFTGHIAAWRESNPRGYGINWSSSLEVAFRMIAWSWALHLFQGSPTITPRFEADMLSGLHHHALRVDRYLSYYFSPNSHLTGEALGLFYISALFPSLPGADRWRTLGAEILERESARQILADGVYFEQSTYYHRYTAEIYLHFLILAGLAGVEVSDGVRDRVGRLLDALLTMLRPDGSMPQIGDSDGGRLVPLDVRDPSDVRDVFSTAAVLFRRADYAWVAGEIAPETLWLLGPAAVDIFDALRPAPPATAPSRALPEGGYVVLRTTWDREADQVLFDAGPLGCPISGAHGHADLLGVECSFRGRPYVVDPGTFVYTDERGWRSYFRSTAAHSTVDVDGRGQATPRGPFAWDGRRPRARLLRWEPGEDLDFAEAEHRAFERLDQPVVHRRRVILVKAGYCVLVDDLQGEGEHRLDVRFQLAPMPARLDPDLWLRAGSVPGPGLFIGVWSTVPLKATLAEGDVEPPQGWVSADYGVRAPAPMLTYSAVTALPVRILTLLLPVQDLSDRPAVSCLFEAGTPVGLAGPALGILRVAEAGPQWKRHR